MNKKIGWKAVTMIAASLLIFSMHPEVRLLGFLVQAIGVDVLALIIGAQVAVVWGLVYHPRILPLLLWLNAAFEKIDPFYFFPSRKLVHQCPTVVMHAVPLLVPLCFFVFGQVLIYA